MSRIKKAIKKVSKAEGFQKLGVEEVENKLNIFDYSQLPKPGKNKGDRGQLFETALGIPNGSDLIDLIDGELKSFTEGGGGSTPGGANGGGGGVTGNVVPAGGSTYGYPGGAGVNPGGNPFTGGGGGGAGEAGQPGGPSDSSLGPNDARGGNGLVTPGIGALNWIPTSLGEGGSFSGGGAGAGWSDGGGNSTVPGGTGGGGNATNGSPIVANTAGDDGTGGGGAGGQSGQTGKDGGSGILIVRYLTP